MKKTKFYTADYAGIAIHPGEHLQDELEARNMNASDFAFNSGLSIKTVRNLINGEINITVNIAIKIDKTLKIDAISWIKFQEKYETTKARLKAEKSIEKLKELNHKD